ncbi:carbon-nitrogen family hydrolase [Laceyella putida]|uniref:Carbon-nitrogen family hydrolase n=1 Tax=Laceyella putida TaxID=110101 RepID=A0ABW2RIA7_9BACL
MRLKCAVIQMDIAFGQPESNMAMVERKIADAATNNPDVIVLPELWTTGYDLPRLDEIADSDAATVKAFMAKLARQYGVHIIAGSVAERNAAGTWNTLLAFNSHGEQVGEYRKVHLFRLMDEEKYLQPGERMGSFELAGIPCAGVICYDIRFPEWIRKHVVAGAHVLFVVAEWPMPRLSHWRNLLITRAIENQCYVVACNRVGSDPNNTFAGHSLIVDPWGEIVVEAGADEQTLFAEIDLDQVTHIRKQIPIFTDRRPDLY